MQPIRTLRSLRSTVAPALRGIVTDEIRQDGPTVVVMEIGEEEAIAWDAFAKSRSDRTTLES